MTTLRQILANRRNGALSRGPKTVAGKARSRLNALRHGLAAEPSAQKARAIAELAPLFAEDIGGSSTVYAREAAHAQLDLLRVRELRADILDRKTSEPQEGPMRSDAEQMCSKIREMGKLDRYETRALSRRKRALRAMEDEQQVAVEIGFVLPKKH